MTIFMREDDGEAKVDVFHKTLIFWSTRHRGFLMDVSASIVVLHGI
jgi:hypothetical protein